MTKVLVFVTVAQSKTSNNPNLQPRWKLKIVKETLKCSIHICNEKLCKTTKLASVEEVLQLCFTVEDDQVAVGLYHASSVKLNHIKDNTLTDTVRHTRCSERLLEGSHQLPL